MASIYDNIKTAKELAIEVSVNGLSTSIEDICRAQDIFGNSTIDELDALANDIGRDGNGMTTGRKGTRDQFYSILFHIWNWEDATRFYNQHTNPEYKVLDKLGELENEKFNLQESVEKIDRMYRDEKNRASEMFAELMDARQEAAEAKQEIIELKAKLFDLLYNAK